MVMTISRLRRGALAALVLIAATAAQAATHMVRNTNDSGDGSLRAALKDASKGDSILFASNVSGEIALDDSLDMDTDVSIKGPGAGVLTVQARKGVAVSVSNDVTITGLTIAGGETALLLEKGGKLILIESEVENSSGNGIENHGGKLTLLRSTVARNHAVGVVNESGTTTCDNSTVADNGGTGIAADEGKLLVTSCTIAGNAGTGIENREAEVMVQNSIVARNLQGCVGRVRSAGYNLTDDQRCGFADTGDVTTDDPRIGNLARNGGPTLTAAPTSGSPAIDGGDPAGCTDPASGGLLSVDQRNLRRPAGGRCDIGAVETQPVVAGTVVNRILALVDGDPITVYELKDFAGGDPRLRQAFATDQGAVLDLLITKHLIEKEVQAHGIVVQDADVDKYIDNIKKRNQIDDFQLDAALEQQGLNRERYRTQVREELQRAQLINREIRGKVSVSPEEVERYNKEHGEEPSADAKINISQIFLRLPADAPADEVASVEAHANKIYDELKHGADFAEVAQRESQDGAAKTGGKLGAFKPGELREDLEDAVKGLKPGQFSKPVRGSTGIHIVRLDEVAGTTEPGKAAANADTDAIKEQLYAKALEDRYNRWLKEDLRQRHHVEIRP